MFSALFVKSCFCRERQPPRHFGQKAYVMGDFRTRLKQTARNFEEKAKSKQFFGLLTHPARVRPASPAPPLGVKHASSLPRALTHSLTHLMCSRW